MSGLSLLAIFTFWVFRLWHITFVLYSKRKSSITAPAPLTTKRIFKQARLTPTKSVLVMYCHGCADVRWTWIRLFTLSKIWKIREEEDWIFDTQKLADREKVIGKKSQSGPIALLSFILFLQTNVYCPRRDIAQKAKFRGATVVARAYIKESTYSWDIQSVCQKNSLFTWTGAAVACEQQTHFRSSLLSLRKIAIFRRERSDDRKCVCGSQARAAGNRWVMMTFLLFTLASKRWLGWRKTGNPRRDRLGWFCDTYCGDILRYSFALRVISDILWSSCFESYGPKDTR